MGSLFARGKTDKLYKHKPLNFSNMHYARVILNKNRKYFCAVCTIKRLYFYFPPFG